jgi:hypothetical protein
MFTGEEGFGCFFDLTTLHEQYSNLPLRVVNLQVLTESQGFCGNRPMRIGIPPKLDRLRDKMAEAQPLRSCKLPFPQFDVRADDEILETKSVTRVHGCFQTKRADQPRRAAYRQQRRGWHVRMLEITGLDPEGCTVCFLVSLPCTFSHHVR